MSRNKYNGSEKNQSFSLTQMKEFESEIWENTGLFNPEDMCGTWCNDLSLSLLIFKDHSLFKVAFLNVNTAGMVIPEVCPIEEDSKGHYFCSSSGKIRLTFDDISGMLGLDGFGRFFRY